MKLSICIPTYNRSRLLENCLHSIIASSLDCKDYEVCISDNFSSDRTREVVSQFANIVPLKYRKNDSNIGIARNILSVVDLAEGDFVWLVGDDDLIVPDAISQIMQLIDSNPKVDFFYVNAYHLSLDYIQAHPHPFSIDELPPVLPRFSSWRTSGDLPFLDLISPKYSFDFLGGMFLSVFRRRLWNENCNTLDKEALRDKRLFSYLDNTFPHLKIFAKAFANSKAYFNARPLIVCLSGARSWAPMYPLVRSFRLLQALEEYRKYGLPWFQYLHCRNFALGHFLPDILRMALTPNDSGFRYVSTVKSLFKNCLFPNFYFSVVNDIYTRYRNRRAIHKEKNFLTSIGTDGERQ